MTDAPHRAGLTGAVQIPVAELISVEAFLRASGSRQRPSDETMAIWRSESGNPDLTITWNDADAELRAGARAGESLVVSGGMAAVVGHAFGLTTNDEEWELEFDAPTQGKLGAYAGVGGSRTVGPVCLRGEATLVGVAPVYAGGGSLADDRENLLASAQAVYDDAGIDREASALDFSTGLAWGELRVVGTPVNSPLALALSYRLTALRQSPLQAAYDDDDSPDPHTDRTASTLFVGLGGIFE